MMENRLMTMFSMVAVLLGCCRQDVSTQTQTNQASKGGMPYHIFEWRDYDGIDDSPEKAIYLLDSIERGRGNEGIEKLKNVEFPPGTVIRISFPWEEGGDGPIYTEPYSDTDLVQHWLKKGYIVEVERKFAFEDKPRVLRFRLNEDGVAVAGD